MIRILFALIIMVLSACQYERREVSETTNNGIVFDESEKIIGEYGARISEDNNIVPAAMIMTSLEQKETMALTVEGEIREVCQMKGCWLTMDLGNGQTMRITFKDYGFFIPKNSSGYMAVIEGEVKKEWVDVETLKHYAEDEGKSQEEIDAITEPIESFNFVANGAIISEDDSD